MQVWRKDYRKPTGVLDLGWEFGNFRSPGLAFLFKVFPADQVFFVFLNSGSSMREHIIFSVIKIMN